MYYKKTPPKKKGQGNSKGKKPKIAWHPPGETLEGMYLTILSRYPTTAEREIALEYAQKSKLSRRDSTIDIAWALLNTKEFIYKH